jgi:acyl carrier protein
VGVIPINWRQFSRQVGNVPFYAELYHAPVQAKQQRGDQGDWVADLHGRSPAEQRQQVQRYLRTLVARTLATTPEQLNDAQPLITLGIDSLMAVELRNQIQQTTGVTVPITTLLDGASLAVLAVYLGEQLQTVTSDDWIAGTVAAAQSRAQQEGGSTANVITESAGVLPTFTIAEDGASNEEEVIELTL